MQKSWKAQFGLIHLGQTFSILGSAAVQFAIIWWLMIQTESAITLTMAAIVGFLPSLLVGPFAGVWIDRYSRKMIMILADGLVALSSVALGAAFLLFETVPILFIYAILFLRGVGSAFHSPAMQAAIPLLVPGDMLEKAGGWGNLINSLSNMLGPVIGAALMAFLPLAAIMLVDIVGAAFAIVCLLFVTIPNVPPSAEKPEFIKDLVQGFRAIRENRPLSAVFLPMVLCNILYMPLGALFPLLVRTHFGGDAIQSSICEFAFAGGLLVSSLVMGVLGGSKRRFALVSFAIAMLGVLSSVGGLLPPSAFWIFVVGCFFMGATGTFINVPLMAYVQQTIAPEMLGKVFSLMMAAMSLAMPIGLLAAGPASERIGVDNWFLYSGIGLLLTGVACWLITRQYDAQPRIGETE